MSPLIFHLPNFSISSCLPILPIIN
uniref:Uncharacterized protein n=1 Tax=Rhizophora mucronata TaxID=61149 RepID=A0A2P2Q0D0_RHIMU